MPTSQRIVSLLPSCTEICFALGLGKDVAGVSHECDHPPEVIGRPVLTAAKIDIGVPSAEIDRQVRSLVAEGLSVYRIDENRLRDLEPDLVLTQDACDVCAVSFAEVREATERLCGAEVEVVSLTPLTLDDVMADIERVGAAAGVAQRASALVRDLRAQLEELRASTARLERPRVLFLEWIDPPMVAGHWTPELIEIAGGEPVLAHHGRPTGPIDWQTIIEARPEVLLVAPCGFRIEQSLAEMEHLAARPLFRSLPAAATGRVMLADGNAFFNRPGPRLLESAQIAAAAIHPDHFASRFAFGLEVLRSWPERPSDGLA